MDWRRQSKVRKEVDGSGGKERLAGRQDGLRQIGKKQMHEPKLHKKPFQAPPSALFTTAILVGPSDATRHSRGGRLIRTIRRHIGSKIS